MKGVNGISEEDIVGGDSVEIEFTDVELQQLGRLLGNMDVKTMRHFGGSSIYLDRAVDKVLEAFNDQGMKY